MKESETGDGFIPEHPKHVSDESNSHLASKSCLQNNFINDNIDNGIRDSPGEFSDTEVSLKRKKRVQRFSDSESEDENQISISNSDNKTIKKYGMLQTELQNTVASLDSDFVSKIQTHESRIRKVSSDSSSDCDRKSDVPLETSQGSRIKNKRDKFHQKFKNLLCAKRKSLETDVNAENLTNNKEQRDLSDKSRIKKVTSDSSSDSDINKSDTHYDILFGTSQGSRIKNKRDKLHKKFKSLLKSKIKCVETEDNYQKEEKGEERDERNYVKSDDEVTSIEKLKQKIKERTLYLKSTIYDPDSSDEESHKNEIKKYQKKPPKKSHKTTKLTPKPVRMSAKQAMENMQKIKSESNRMLREKEVSLPYHRPKALSLKDIMSRRKPAVSSDGKALPIKMNEDQLKQYALMLAERQKEMMVLCKSDTEEEDIDEDEKNNDNDLTSANDKSSHMLLRDNELSTTNYKSFDILVTKPDTVESKSNIKESLCNESEINVTENSTEEDCLLLKENKNDIVNQEENIPIEKAAINTLNVLEKDYAQTSLKSDSDKESECLSDEKPANGNKIDLENDALDDNASAEIELVYNDSVEDNEPTAKTSIFITNHMPSEVCTENDSQLISLHLDTEKTEPAIKTTAINSAENLHLNLSEENQNSYIKEISEIVEKNEFSENDDEINIEEIDYLIGKAEIVSSQSKESAVFSPMLIKDFQPLKIRPKLMGAPGMVIDLDGTDACAPKKSGVELLKERFTYFAKLKTPEELEREKEKKIKPGTQHLKLKHELEEIIAEQRSLEWAMRLEEEKQQKMEIETVIGDADCEDDIDKIEAKLEENENVQDEENSENEEEEDLLGDDCEIKDKPRSKNPLIDEEAEESEAEDEASVVNSESDDERKNSHDEGEDDSEEESSEEDDEEQSKPKKRRILKAFEDSDDEEDSRIAKDNQENKLIISIKNNSTDCDLEFEKESPTSKITEDDEIQLAQRHKSFSEDLFTSQESVQLNKIAKYSISHEESAEDKIIESQTFSISKSSNTQWYNTEPSHKKNNDEENLNDMVELCTSGFSQNLVTSQTETQKESPTQNIGDDILALCTGKFYDNQFVSQLGTGGTQQTESEGTETHLNNDRRAIVDEGVKSIVKQDNINIQYNKDKDNSSGKNYTEEIEKPQSSENNKKQRTQNNSLQRTDDNLLNSILDELNDPRFETTKPLKYFVGDETQNKDKKPVCANTQPKKRFIIDSDDEKNYNDTLGGNKKKKFKKKKLQDRALQISDDEEEIEEYEDKDEYESVIEHETERIVEYDSEENEVVVQPFNPKKKKKVSEFFEQEAELTSEDEWVGSGDEDEAGLDRMEREEGDNDAFHEGRLRRELEQIHMRDVLDQDKREVRLIQELLLEDGDLGGGHRQRKFRWRDAGVGDDETTYAELADTQEEEFESEEQWRKQRHERETFLRQMKQQEEPEESIDISTSRTSLIKANLGSKTANSSVLDVSDSSIADKSATTTSVVEKKTATDIPSPKKPFTLFQQNYHGSLLTRGQGALARLAALALPLAATDDDKPTVRPSHSGRNFVFTTLSQNDEPLKVTKRKADGNIGTPRLVKKMRTADNKKDTKNSLLDHLNT